MEKPADKQDPERNRDLPTKVTDDEQRNQTRHLMAEEEAKEAPAIGRDEILVRTNGAIKAGVIWA
jgi:hypothetical protein